MSNKNHDKVMLSEQIFEIRHDTSGTFLDVRGHIADFVRKENFLNHWKIDTNVVNFRDTPDKILSQGAFVGFKSIGYVSLNPPTYNFFSDRANAFWKLLKTCQLYKIPKPTRFGVRTKIFVPSIKSFEDINNAIYEKVFTEKLRQLFGGNEKDLQFTIIFKVNPFEMRVTGGPMHKNEASQHFQFESDDFKKSGLYIDIDFYKTDNFSESEIPNLLKDAVKMTWEKAERVKNEFGI